MASSNNMSLTKVAGFSKKAIYFAAAGFFLLALTTYFMRQYKEYQRLHPPVVKEVPNYLFGKLPEIVFPEEPGARKAVTLELSTGAFPVAPPIVKVFSFITTKPSGFDPVESARAFATLNDFSAGEIKLSDEEYAFVSSENRFKKMIINVVNQTFEVKSDLKSDYSILTAYDLPSPQEAIDFSLQFLQKNDLWQPIDANSQTKIIYYKITPEGNLEKTILPFEANLIQIIFFRENISEFPVFYSKETEGSAVFLLAGGKDGTPKIVETKYSHFAVDEINFGKYYALSPASAWDQFTNGKKGHIISVGEEEKPIVRQIYLGLYDDLTSNGFLQPVWVFDGDKNFRAIVPAVDPK